MGGESRMSAVMEAGKRKNCVGEEGFDGRYLTEQYSGLGSC
jgi:hypothetical protein